MTTTIAKPADPVTNGASEIQTTNFALVAADYTQVLYPAVRFFLTKSGNGKPDLMPSFNNGNIDPSWMFFLRKDLAGDVAARNLIGVHIVSTTGQATSYSSALGRQVVMPVVSHRAEVYNWNPARLTLTDGTIITRWVVDIASYTFVVDPESGAFLSGDGSHRSLYEAVNFLLTPVAANKPSNAPALALVTGISPV
jgi:hypothetical protein